MVEDSIPFKNNDVGHAHYVKQWNNQGDACRRTKPGNGIATPTPTQLGMFVKVNAGDTCDSISFWNNVGGSQFVKQWNGQGEACNDL
ncbi:hypothetical protein N0V88_006827 [Collariella sp. IMI 366227]|nr:hypothetical protein N0V88_006827 [Collariella sp. IMI 366227]